MELGMPRSFVRTLDLGIGNYACGSRWLAGLNYRVLHWRERRNLSLIFERKFDTTRLYSRTTYLSLAIGFTFRWQTGQRSFRAEAQPDRDQAAPSAGHS